MYSFNLEGTVKDIKENKAKKILLHLPDGLKPKAKEIQDQLKYKVDAEIFIWAGSCFGACDLPIESQNIGIDMIVHFGHTKWKY